MWHDLMPNLLTASACSRVYCGLASVSSSSPAPLALPLDEGWLFLLCLTPSPPVEPLALSSGGDSLALVMRLMSSVKISGQDVILLLKLCYFIAMLHLVVEEDLKKLIPLLNPPLLVVA